MLKARISAKAQEQLQSTVGRLGTNSDSFERMEEKVLMQEARAQSAAELVGADLESQFAALESGSDVDDELAAQLRCRCLAPLKIKHHYHRLLGNQVAPNQSSS